MATESYLDWLNHPQQIILSSLFFVLLCIVVTKLSKRRNKHKDFSVRDPRKGHRWVVSDFIVKPTYCNACGVSLVRGVFCDTCWICVHDECEDEGNKQFVCKLQSVSDQTTPRHQWVKGNLPFCSKCRICNYPCGVEPRLCDYRCLWCQATVHEGECYAKDVGICDFGDNKEIILPPYCVSLKLVGWRGRRRYVIKEVRKPAIKNWRPLLVVVNPKSGGHEGVRLLKAFRGLLNPAQVIDLSEISPEVALEFCCLLPDIQSRILVCGGDGTVGWILDTIDKVNIPIKPHVGIYPQGTGNDLARVLGWGLKYVGDEHELVELLKDLEEADVVSFDRWCVNIANTGFFDRKPPLKTLCMNSYVSVGCDAQVVLNFHKHRETQPFLFTSRILNKFIYFIYGSRDVLEAQCKNLYERLELELDGQSVPLPAVEGIVVLNINSWCGGCQIWDTNENGDGSFPPSKFNDGYLEVVGLYSSLHIGKIQVGLANALQIGRARQVRITVKKTKDAKNVPMQVDGEPWEQGPCVITVNRQSQALLLQKANLNVSS